MSPIAEWGPCGVEVVDPAGDHRASMAHREEEMLVEAFVPHPPLETLGAGVSRVGLPGAM